MSARAVLTGIGTLNVIAPVAGFAANVSPVPRSAPPPFGNAMAGTVLPRLSLTTRTQVRGTRIRLQSSPPPIAIKLGAFGRAFVRHRRGAGARAVPLLPATRHSDLLVFAIVKVSSDQQPADDETANEKPRVAAGLSGGATQI